MSAADQQEIERLSAQNHDYFEALKQVAALQGQALAVIRDNGFVFKNIGTERGNFEHLAFTLYSEICEIDVVARNALGWPLIPDAETKPAEADCDRHKTALEWADSYLSSLDDEGARVVRRKIAAALRAAATEEPDA